MKREEKNAKQAKETGQEGMEKYSPLFDLAKKYNISRDYLNTLINRKKLKAKKIGRIWFYRREWLEEYLARDGKNKKHKKVNPVRNKSLSGANGVNLKPYIIGLAAFILAALGLIKLVALNNNQADYYFQLASPATYDQPLLITSFSRVFSIQPIKAMAAQMIQEKGNVIRYIDAYNNTDVVQTRHATKLKEDIILKQPGHPDKFEYQINLDQYDFAKTSNGDFVFYPHGKAGDELSKVFTIPAPYMIDSNNNKSSVEDVETILTKEGILTIQPDPKWLAVAVYPVILDPTIEINVLNVLSHPQQGDNWEVEFTAQGRADLKIIPEGEDTIDDDEFISLSCDEEIRNPQILAGDIIYFPDWQCLPPASAGWAQAGTGIGKVVHYTKKAGNHTLRFEFGPPGGEASGQTAYADNGPEINRKWLEAGGIDSVMKELPNEEKKPKEFNTSAEEIAARKAGEEIVSLRKDNTQVFKSNKNNEFQAKIYAGPKYYLDEANSTYKEIDASVQEISALAKSDPKRLHERWFVKFC